MRIKRINIIGAFAGLLAMAGLTACSESSLEDLHNGTFDNKSYLTLTFVTPSEGTPTRAADMATRASNYEDDGYEDGIEFESTIDFENDNYKIYFFTYSNNDTKGGTLIAEFEPTEITPTSTGSSTAGTEVTKYTLTGNVPDALENYSSFRVVVLANWGTYPEVTPNSTTIDDLCEANTESPNSTVSTYAAMVDEQGTATMTSTTNLIPFFGVQEYTGVSFKTGETTTLGTPISLLRAVAKVEIIITAEGSVQELNDNGASIVNYNSTGYCAPWAVYTAAGYDTSASYNPNSGNWDKEWVDGLHLVGNANDTESKTILMYKVQDYATTDPETGEPLATPQLETWRAYVPEYNNMSTDYSYMTVTFGEGTEAEKHEIYFAEYSANTGTTTAYGEDEGTDMPDRLNIKRNNLYRFYVTISPFSLYVYIDILPWVERQDDYEF